MSYYDRGGYGGGGYRNHYHRGGFHQHNPRINENEVPQSKHTIFIRGLTDVTTEEIKEYIGERVGEISFDFVKTSNDRSKIFVAVRFEKREEAKTFMETYSEREFMGCRVELSWFRDIRRYCAYQRSKNQRSVSPRRRQRSDSEGSKHSSRKSSPRRSRSRSRDRESRTGSPESRRSKSASKSRSRSRSPDRTRSRSPDRTRSRSRSRSRGDRYENNRRFMRRGGDYRPMSISPIRTGRRQSEESDGEEEKRRIKERQERYKRRHIPSTSDIDNDEEDLEEKVAQLNNKKKQKPAQIPLPPQEPKIEVFIPPPTVDMELESPKSPVNPYASFPGKSEPIAAVQSTLYSMPMEDESAPKVVIRDPVPAPVYAGPIIPAALLNPPPPVQKFASAPAAPAQVAPPPEPTFAPPPPLPAAPAPPALPPFVPRQVGKIEIVMPVTLPAPVAPAPVAPAPAPAPAPAKFEPTLSLSGFNNGNGLGGFSGGVSEDQLPQTNKLFGHLKTFQADILKSFEDEMNKPEEKKDGGFTLSHNLQSAENQKKMEREEKLARLSGTQMMHFHLKKKQLEGGFRNDCETFAHVTRALFSKDIDRSQEFHTKLWGSLLENMEDLHNKMMDRVDELLDQLLG